MGYTYILHLGEEPGGQGGSSLDSYFHPSTKHIGAHMDAWDGATIPQAQADNSASDKVASEISDWGPGLEMASATLVAPGWEMLLCAGVLSALAENHGLLGIKAPHPHRRTYQAALAQGSSENLHLFIFLLPSPSRFPTPKTAGWEKVMH